MTSMTEERNKTKAVHSSNLLKIEIGFPAQILLIKDRSPRKLINAFQYFCQKCEVVLGYQK